MNTSLETKPFLSTLNIRNIITLGLGPSRFSFCVNPMLPRIFKLKIILQAHSSIWSHNFNGCIKLQVFPIIEFYEKWFSKKKRGKKKLYQKWVKIGMATRQVGVGSRMPHFCLIYFSEQENLCRKDQSKLHWRQIGGNLSSLMRWLQYW